MNEPTALEPLTKNRSVGLIVFGILTLMGGVICALFVPLILFAASFSEKSGQGVSGTQSLLPAMATYGVMAVSLIWLGVGSILKRRWARALLLITSWSGLLMGIVSLISTLLMVPPMLKRMTKEGAEMSSNVTWIAMGTAGAVLLVIFLILPTIWLCFYRSPHVKATCEFYDPVPRWTDGCPFPVLAAVIWLGVSAVASAGFAVIGPAVLPVFGTFVLGIPAKILLLATGLVWAYGAWGFYRLKLRAWWGVALVLAIFMLSAIVTYASADILEIYPKLGYSPEQVAQMAEFNIMKGPMLVWLTVLWCIPVFGFLIYLHRYFPSVKPGRPL